uniref:RRM domain-containing protein n=1 Tax=Plectus sambesii TaxID=2011161 RepID=A0A914VBC2_9BILA
WKWSHKWTVADYDGYGPRGGYGSYGDDDGYYGRSAGGGPVRAGRGGRGGMGGGYGRPAARPETDGGSAPFGKHCIKMRGLPYRAAERDIIDFFAPLRVAKIHILTEYGSGRPSGEGRVEFFTHLDAVEAMKRDREHMGSRYVELFLESDASDRMLYPDY